MSQKRKNLRVSTCLTLLRRYSIHLVNRQERSLIESSFSVFPQKGNFILPFAINVMLNLSIITVCFGWPVSPVFCSVVSPRGWRTSLQLFINNSFNSRLAKRSRRSRKSDIYCRRAFLYVSILQESQWWCERPSTLHTIQSQLNSVQGAEKYFLSFLFSHIFTFPKGCF